MSLWSELKRLKVVRVGIAYLVVALARGTADAPRFRGLLQRMWPDHGPFEVEEAH